MNKLHWTALGGFFASLSALTCTLPTWQAAYTPAFLGSVIGLFGSFFVALMAGQPSEGSAMRSMADSVIGIQPATPPNTPPKE